LGSLKIGYLREEFERITGPRKKLYDDALETLRKAGAKLDATELPPSLINVPTGPILQAEAAAAFDDITRDGRVRQLRGQDAGSWPNSFRTSRLIPAVEYIRAMRARTLLQRQMDDFMGQW